VTDRRAQCEAPSEAARRRFGAWVAVVATCVLGGVGLIAATARIEGPTVSPWQWTMVLIAWAVSGAGLSVMAWLLATTPGDAIRLSPKVGAGVVLAVGLGLRLALVLTTTPQFSDDIYRYAHDGATLLEGVSPYARAPAQTPDADARINNPSLVTIYLPASQAAFAGLAAVDRAATSLQLPLRTDQVFRLGWLAVDAALIAVLMLVLHREGRSVWWAALYAWHPLGLIETTVAGHQDVLGVLALAVGLALAGGLIDRGRGPKEDRHRDRHQAAWAGRGVGAGVALGLGVLVKPIVAAALLTRAGRGARANSETPELTPEDGCPRALARGGAEQRVAPQREPRVVFVTRLLTTAAVVLLGFAVFALWPPGLGPWWRTVTTFTNTWSFNAIVHPLFAEWFGRSAASAFAACAALAVALAHRRDPWRAVALFAFTALLLSSTVHPWYLLWALAPMALRFSLPVWTWSLTIVLAHHVWLAPEAWRLPAWATAAEYGPVAAAIGVSAVAWAVRQKRGQIVSSQRDDATR